MVLALQVELSESGVGDKGTPDRCRSFVSDVVPCEIERRMGVNW